MDSPKRKHWDEEDMQQPELDRNIRYQSPLVVEEHIQQSGRDSPRSKVAQRLESLDIRSDGDQSGSPRKRVRLNTTSSAGSESRVNQNQSTLQGTMKVTKRVDQQRRSRSPDTKEVEDSASLPAQVSPNRRIRSPPPPTYVEARLQTEANAAADPLTWQISEITGMNLDTTAGDDGEGLNGIGFRPSPQIAFARRQKRKQQISDWRMREARDARQKRFDKRHGCKLHEDGAGNQERSVRFAEML